VSRRTWVVSLLAVLAGAAPAQAQSGPALTVPEPTLDAALECRPATGGPARDPVLLVHGTTSTAQESFGSGYLRVLPTQGFPTCAVTLPERATVDIQVSSEYVVRAVRRMAASSGRRVSVIGHSQGTLQPLWAMRFWPDVRAAIGEYVALAAPYEGTATAEASCRRECAPPIWQFRPGSAWLGALKRNGPPSAGVDSTSIATQFDQLVVPAPAVSRIPGASNVVVQEVCPGRTVEHGALLFDAATYAIVRDALDNPGPADRSRISPAVCAQVTFPGADGSGGAALAANFGPTLAAAPRTQQEPPLRCYATVAGCPADGGGAGAGSGTPARTTPRRPARLRASTRVRRRGRAVLVHVRTSRPARVVISVQRGRRTVHRRVVRVRGTQRTVRMPLRRVRQVVRLVAEGNSVARRVR